jgi:hypothetical protein
VAMALSRQSSCAQRLPLGRSCKTAAGIGSNLRPSSARLTFPSPRPVERLRASFG